MSEPEKILISLSGGPGSLAVAWILRKQGKNIRGVFFDVLEDPELTKTIESFERKLGISIQVIPAKVEVEKLLVDEMRASLIAGKRLNLKELFHQRYLLPRLYELKESHHFQKVATGHRVKVRVNSIDQIAHLYSYDDLSQDEAPLMLGRTQKDLMALELPLGGLPPAMIDRIAEELEIKEDAGRFDLDWNGLFTQARKTLAQGDRLADIYTVQGMRLGSHQDYATLTVGDAYQVAEEVGRAYQILDISPNERRIIVDDPRKRKLTEIHLEDVAWVARNDLGLHTLQCQMTWRKNETRSASVSLLQFEGNRVKAFLNDGLSGPEADIFHGQTVLWISGGEVLGGARVLRCK